MPHKLDDDLGLRPGSESQNEIIAEMKEQGLTITQAIKESMRLFGVGLGDAKALVTSHPTWASTAHAAEPFQEALIQAFQDQEGSGK